MSKSEVLYVKGMNVSESEDEENYNDIWDDRKLNDAYDKALKIANAEVARRVAMSTNTKQGDHRGGKEDKPQSKKEKAANSNNVQWKVSMPCRAVYDGDGIEYEALVERILNDKECVVRFIGYENSEIVPLSSLKASLGKEERRAQMENALYDKKEDAANHIHDNVHNMDTGSDRIPSPGSTEKSFSKKKKKSKQRKHQNQIPMTNGFEMPNMAIPMPNPSMLRNLNGMGSMDMPMPPPPLMFPTSTDRVDSEEQAISSMLISWYMSGYYTGLYQGLRRSKENHKD